LTLAWTRYNLNPYNMDKSDSKSTMLIFILVSLVGLALTIYGTSISLNAYRTKSWPTTQGTVIASEVIKPSKYVPRVTYTYDIDTNVFSSERIQLKDMAQYKTRAGAEKVANKYPVDAKVTVYYNPTKFDEAILEPGVKGFHIFMFFLGLVIFVGPLLNFIPTNRKPKEGV
jgi:hypothetical protein